MFYQLTRRHIFLFLLFIPMLSSAQVVCFNDVKQILTEKCGSCHKEGEAAPFVLSSFEDYFKRLKLIKSVILSGYMPPWKTDSHYQLYSNDRSLTKNEKTRSLNGSMAEVELK